MDFLDCLCSSPAESFEVHHPRGWVGHSSLYVQRTLSKSYTFMVASVPKLCTTTSLALDFVHVQFNKLASLTLNQGVTK